jgi:hypothetical protein
MPLWQNMHVAMIYIYILFSQQFTVSLSITNSVLKIYITAFHYRNSSTSDSSCYTSMLSSYSTCGTHWQLVFTVSYHHTICLQDTEHTLFSVQCDTVRYTLFSVQCDTIQYTLFSVQHDAVQYTLFSVQRDTAQYTLFSVQHVTIQYTLFSVQRDTIQYMFTVQRDTIQYTFSVQCDTVQYALFSVQHDTVQYSYGFSAVKVS